MSWPSIWQSQNQPQGAGTQTTAVNPTVYSLTPEQQFALQQQQQQQWQIYQTQLAQWTAQYGEAYQQMQKGMMAQNVLPNAYMPGIVAPPLPDFANQPPPPPPPQQQQQQSPSQQQQHQQQQHQQQQSQLQHQPQQQPPPPIQSIQPQIGQLPNYGRTVANNSQNVQPTAPIDDQKSINHNSIQSNQGLNAMQTHTNQNQNFDYSSNSQNNQDYNRRNNRVNRWNHNNNGSNNSNNSSNFNNFNNNNRNNRMFGGNNLNERNTFDNDNGIGNQQTVQAHDNEEKSQEEIAFDIQFRKWEDSFNEWKRNNANHPDQSQYNDFVTKMEGCRKQLLQRRETLKQKRLDAIRDAQKSQTPQMDLSVKSEPQTQEINQMNVDQSNVMTSNESSAEMITEDVTETGLFSSEKNAGIPGLDLVSDDNMPQSSKIEPSKPDSNIVAHVNNILGNPQIQSLLSNIQRQQNETALIQQTNEFDAIEKNNVQCDNPNSANRFGKKSRFDSFQCNETPQRNPFRPNQRNDDELSQQNQFEPNSKRGRFWNENNSNDRTSFDHFNRNRDNFQMQQTTNPDIGMGDFRNNRNRFSNADTFNNSNVEFDASVDEIDEFRPMQIIDYQNQSQNCPPLGNQLPFSMQSTQDIFARKIIEYDHKSKIHPWNWFCPVQIIEYNHTKTGRSMHEHPPPKPAKQEPESNQRFKTVTKDDQIHMRQLKWPSNERQERYRSPGERNFNQRFDQRQNSSTPTNSQMSNENQPYYGRNTQDRNWTRNYREYNAPPAELGYERSRYDKDSSSSINQRYNVPMKQQSQSPPNPKCNLKNLLFPPWRHTRPKKIVILMRGVPGSGKSFISKLIKDKEQEMGGSARILSIDDYFMTEDDIDAKQMIYEYDAKMENTYTQYLLKSFKKTLLDNLYDCVIVDCKNTTLQYLTEFYMIAKTHSFEPFVCEMPLDAEKCYKNNIHHRTEEDIRHDINEWIATPSSYTILNYQCLFDSAGDTEEISDIEDREAEIDDSLDAISDDENADVDRNMDDDGDFTDNDGDGDGDDEPINEFGLLKSKWDNDSTENKLARLDGINKPIKHTTIEDYLQMDGWEPPPTSSNGKKRVRWKDIEQKREQDKQRAIGFIVGQTDWRNLIDEPRDHSNALTAVKYIEKVRKK